MNKSTANEMGPSCGKCGKKMTPENSKRHPEYFACDTCLSKIVVLTETKKVSYPTPWRVVGNDVCDANGLVIIEEAYDKDDIYLINIKLQTLVNQANAGAEAINALKRLASMEAFSMATAIGPKDHELVARIDYARNVLGIKEQREE